MQRVTASRRTGGALAVGVGAWLMVMGSASGATIDVTAKEDRLAHNGDCTLREAVISANEDRALDACGKGSWIDTIQLGSGTYRLTIPGPLENLAATGDLDITDRVELVGRPGETHIVAAPDDRILHVIGVHARVSGLTLTGGDVTAQGTKGYFEEGRGGGILLQSTVPDTAALLELVDSTVSANRAIRGGAIGTALDRAMNPYLETSGEPRGSGAEIIRSTISNNRSEGDGGGFYAEFGGGTLRSSTVSGNVAGGRGGGLSSFLGGFEILNSTIAHNRAVEGGGFISFGASAEPNLVSQIGGSIVAGNRAEIGPDCSGTMDSSGANVLGATPGCELRPRQHAEPDLLGVDPRLGPLAHNGGPTATHAIGPQSPANNLYSLSEWSPFARYPFVCEGSDQRGEPRSADGRLPRCDAGAFEVVECMGVPATITGGGNDDLVVGTAGADVIHAVGGNDRVRSLGGNDVICSGSGEDLVDAGPGHDRVEGGPDGDVVSAGPGDDHVRGLQPGGLAWLPPNGADVPGLSDRDSVSGGRGDDRLLGQMDDDRLRGGHGRDRLDGGGGRDACDGGLDRNRLRDCETPRPSER